MEVENPLQMKTRKVVKIRRCPTCERYTSLQIWDYVHKIWIYYCAECQQTIDDPFS